VFFYRSARLLFRLIARPAFHFTVEGEEHVPRQGPAVLVAAHRSWLDPACVGGAVPRPVRFLILESIYCRPWARWFYAGMGSIPVGAPGGPPSVRPLREALRVLQAGGLLGVFPEGRVFSAQAPGPLQPGAALLALRGAAPLIPIDIRGSDRAWPHGSRWPRPAPIRVCIGPPIAPPSASGRDAAERLTASVGQALRALAAGTAGG